ncbi:MAG: protein kinase [Acidobacteria bacterium]|nr:protein kinase [Acidobacteriota bacterium]MBI3427553.1 protein kinase [Acidobacteriota bacterium]
MKEWLRSGTMIQQYRIVMRIGVSAIGEVYQVRDDVNFRDCALKLLSANLLWDDNSRQRFLQIVKSAPPLDHPNISKILDAGVTASGQPFVVTEIVHGRTLDEIGIGLARKLGDKIQIAIETADALAAAHAQGILHLGLKPANVMLDHQSKIRVLDFAVTLATQIALMSRGPKAPPQQMTIGKARYLSPEQIRGEKPTPQSDIFSLGILVYELFSSQLPFPGKSIEEVCHNILNTEPEPLTLENHEVPPAVNPILMKALAKNPAQRYRTAAEFAAALRQLAVEEKTAELARSKGKLKKDNEGAEELETQSWLELLKELLKKLQKQLIISLIFAITAAAFGLTYYYRKDQNFKLPEELLPFTKITTSGKVLEAVLSPDGKGLAYLVEDGPRQNLLYQNLKDRRDRLIYSTKDTEIGGLTFSRFNDFVYFVKSAPAPSELYKVPITGGVTPKILANIASPVTTSPSNQQIAFVRQNGAESQLVSYDLKNQTENVITTRQSPTQFVASGPAWSQDGKLIACAVKKATDDLTFDIVLIDVEGGIEKPFVSGPWVEISRLAWMAGDEGLLVNGRTLEAQQWQIWRILRATGEVRAMTNGVNDYRGLSLTNDRRLALSVNFVRDVVLWLGTSDSAQQLTIGQDDGVSGLAWAGNHQLIYTSRANHRDELWLKKTDSTPTQFLKTFWPPNSRAVLNPIGTATGQSAIFAAVVGDQAQLWQGDLSGDNKMQQLTNGQVTLFPQLSSDGGTLFYSLLANGRASIAKRKLSNGETAVLLEGHAWGGVVSPDGSRMACNFFDEASNSWKLLVAPVAGGAPAVKFDLPGTAHRLLRWLPDGSGIAYPVTQRGVTNLWKQPLDGSAPSTLTTFTKHRIYNFAWSPDGQQLAVSRGRRISDAVTISGWATDKR